MQFIFLHIELYLLLYGSMASLGLHPLIARSCKSRGVKLLHTIFQWNSACRSVALKHGIILLLLTVLSSGSDFLQELLRFNSFSMFLKCAKAFSAGIVWSFFCEGFLVLVIIVGSENVNLLMILMVFDFDKPALNLWCSCSSLIVQRSLMCALLKSGCHFWQDLRHFVYLSRFYSWHAHLVFVFENFLIVLISLRVWPL